MRRSRSRSHHDNRFPSERRTGARDDLVYGRNPVREALRASPAAITRLWLAQGARDVEDVVAAARAAGIAVEHADAAALDELVRGANHQGVVAEAAPFAYAPLEVVLSRNARVLVALDGINDPQNLGAIMRSAEVLGAGGLILPRDRAAPVTAAAVRASSGASAHLPVAQVVNLVRALEDAKAAGYWVVALEAGGAQTFASLPALDRAVLVIGGEGTGLRRLVAETADFRTAIPVGGRVGSLNASAAAAIGIYALRERIEAADGPGRPR
jgi:23S rRNA (guanosine2251-2'-O)-methyltransferase